jgi:hypothetical protein
MMSKPTNAAYAALRTAAADVGWPTHFQNDLTEHDRCRLHGGDAPTVFGWVLRELGTHLIDPRCDTKLLRGYINHFGGPDGDKHLYFWWDGSRLDSLSREHWCVMLRQAHEELERRATRERRKAHNAHNAY